MPKEQKVTLDEVVEVMGAEVRKAVDQYFDFLQKTVSFPDRNGHPRSPSFRCRDTRSANDAVAVSVARLTRVRY
jgi:hypothetical protein